MELLNKLQGTEYNKAAILKSIMSSINTLAGMVLFGMRKTNIMMLLTLVVPLVAFTNVHVLTGNIGENRIYCWLSRHQLSGSMLESARSSCR